MLSPKRNISRSAKVHSFLPKFSDGVLVGDVQPHKRSPKRTRRATTSSLLTSSPTQVSKHVQRRSSTESKPQKRLSWLVEPVPTPRPKLRRSSKCSRKISSLGGAECRSSFQILDREGDFSSSEYTCDSTSSDYGSMSNHFPMTSKTGKFVLRKHPNQRNIAIETSDGEMAGSVDFIHDGTMRLMKDASGKTCAVILKTPADSVNGGNVFKVYSNKPATQGQQKSKKNMVNGLYLWAEIKNTGSMGGKFVMKRYSSETSSCSTNQHVAKRFGSLFSKGKSKGYKFVDSEEKECVKMISLKNRAKGLLVAPNRDTCLMLAFSTVVDEIVEKRLR